MKTKTKIAGVAVLALTALGGGIAHAQASNSAPTRTEVVTDVTSRDTDTLQQGDQTTPDNLTGAAAATGDEANEKAEEAGAESESASDGPGGHQDPPGDVQHEGGAGEQ
jgi:hypothetical protein